MYTRTNPRITRRHWPQRAAQGGIALISALLLLLVVTIFALAMFRSYGVQERIAGNVREKQRALQAAESVQQFAEFWLSQNAAGVAAVPCTTSVNITNVSQVQVCSAALTNPGNYDSWPGSATYNPNNTMNIQTTPSSNTYGRLPQFYIADLGANAAGEVYQVEAAGFAGTINTVAVVESTLVVQQNTVDRGGL